MTVHRYSKRWKRAVLWRQDESFYRETITIRFFVTLILLLLASGWLSHTWIVEVANNAAEDVVARLRPAQVAQYTRIIGIDQVAYERYFHSQSPLNPGVLATAIEKIISMEPAVLAIDVDTSAPQFKTMSIPKTGIPIVWARSASDIAGELQPDPVLGQREQEPLWGFAVLTFKRDPTIRSVPRSFHVGNLTWPSFPWSIVTTFCARTPSPPGCAEILKSKEGPWASADSVFLSRYVIPAIPLAEIMTSHDTAIDNSLRGKVVLLGGSYSTGDQQLTPYGFLPGVEVMTSAVEAELGVNTQAELGRIATVGIEVILAVIIAWFHFQLRPLFALLATVLFLVLAVLFGGFMAFYVGAYRAGFVPFVVGIWVEQMIESALHAQRRK